VQEVCSQALDLLGEGGREEHRLALAGGGHVLALNNAPAGKIDTIDTVASEHYYKRSSIVWRWPVGGMSSPSTMRMQERKTQLRQNITFIGIGWRCPVGGMSSPSTMRLQERKTQLRQKHYYKRSSIAGRWGGMSSPSTMRLHCNNEQDSQRTTIQKAAKRARASSGAGRWGACPRPQQCACTQHDTSLCIRDNHIDHCVLNL
jgi:hypothetical protein